jgi:hypothetical protein
MVLFDDIVKVFDLADDDGRAVLLVVALDGRFIGVTAVNRDRLGSPLRRMAFFRNRNAASVSRCSVSRKSIGFPCLSTARYKYRHTPFTLIYACEYHRNRKVRDTLISLILLCVKTYHKFLYRL